MNGLFRVCAISTVALLAAYPYAFADNIGSVAAVNRDMEGTPPEGGRRALNLGDQVVRNELIETSTVGSGQIVFLDQTTLSVAPNSNVVLDKYVYDPAEDQGEIALRVTQGALRFIGGRITKKRKAIVKTPQSTIGIRGGMAVISVGEDGSGRVVLMAGEFIDIEGLDGGIVTLSRPNATATIDTAGNVAFAGIATSEDLEQVFRALEGEGDGGTGDEISEDGVDNVAQVNSEEKGISNEAPISTQGEIRVGSDLGIDDDSVLRDLETAEIADPEPEPELPPPPPPPPPLAEELPLPGSGAVILTTGGGDAANSSIVPVSRITEGSLIADLADGSRLVIDLPSDPRELSPVSTAEVVSTDGFTGLTIAAPAGPDAPAGTGPDFGIWLTGPSDSLNGETPFGFGISDLNADNPFHVVSLAALSPELTTATAVFGNPTEGQGLRHSLDDGAQDPRANTLDVYRAIDLNLHASFSSDGDLQLGFADEAQRPFEAGAELLLTGNTGADRVPSDTDTPSGARWLSAQVSEGRLGVLAGEVTPSDGGAPALEQHITNIGRNSVQTDSFATLPDSEGNTFFSEDARFTVLTNTTTGGGQIETFSGPDAGTSDSPGITQLFERDAGSAAIVAADSDVFTNVADTPILLPVALPDIQIGTVSHMNGFFTCSTGNCGSALSGEGSTGVWGAAGRASLSAGSTARLDDGSNEGLDTNALGASASLAALDAVNANASGTELLQGPLTLQLDAGFQSDTGTGTFINDQQFGLNAPDSAFVTRDNVRAEISSEFLLASSGAAGLLSDDFFPEGVNADPVHLRWGYWAADLAVTDGDTGGARHDTLTNGFFTFGRPTGAADLPGGIIAEYEGLVAASLADLDTGLVQEVGGDFKLTYDFRRENGVVDLAIPTAGYDFTSIPVDEVGNGFTGTQDFGNAGASSITLDGTFFSGGGGDDPAAGVGGSIDIRDVDQNRRTLGILAGDRTFTLDSPPEQMTAVEPAPSEMPTVAPAEEVPFEELPVFQIFGAPQTEPETPAAAAASSITVEDGGIITIGDQEFTVEAGEDVSIDGDSATIGGQVVSLEGEALTVTSNGQISTVGGVSTEALASSEIAAGGDIVLAGAGTSGATTMTASASTDVIATTDTANTEAFNEWGAWNAPVPEAQDIGGSIFASLLDSPTPNSVSELPSGVVARYDGVVVAEHVTATGQTATVNGDFGLTYDFGTGSGAAELAIPDAGYDFQQIQVDQAGAGFAGGQRFGADSASSVSLRGGFYSAGGASAAVAAGGLNIQDVDAGSTTSGTFFGSRSTDR